MGIQAVIRKGIEHGLNGLAHVDRIIRTGMSLYLLMRYWGVEGDKHKISPRVTDGTLYVLSGGPSLDRQVKEYGDFLTTKDTICVNSMPITPLYEYLRPNYYFYAADAFIYPDEKFIPEARVEVTETFEALVENTKWEIVVFLPEWAQRNEERIRYIQSNPFIKIEYLSPSHYIGYENLRYRLLKGKFISFKFDNVLIGAINAGIFLGYKHIYLLGADHDYLATAFINDSNILCKRFGHFYDLNPTAWEFDVDDGTMRSYAQYLEDNAELWNEYYDIAKYARREGIEIFNATRGSYIDAFERRYTLEE